MNMIKYIVLLLLVQQITFAQNLFTLDSVKTYRLYFYDNNWDEILDSFAINNIDEKILADLVVDGITYDSVGVKYKGNSSYNENQIKNPFHIELDYVKNQDIEGFENLKLSNMFKDPSCVREVLSYEILRNYMPEPLSNYVMLYVNNNLIGLYACTQSINKDFVNEKFGSKNGSFFKCDPITITGSPTPPPPGCPPVQGIASPLVYLGTDTACYKQSYEIQSDNEEHWFNLVDLIYNVNYSVSQLSQILDIDRTLWMLAFNNLFVNMDSYTGSGHNYYIYQNEYMRFNPIIWDLNENFGVFGNLGGQPPTQLTLSDMINFDPMYGYDNPDRPLLVALLNDSNYKKMYFAHYRTLLNEFVVSDSMKNRAVELQNMIDPYVQADPNKLYTYSEFQNNLDNNVVSGMLIPGINVLMDARETYLLSNSEIQKLVPVISNVQNMPSTPNSTDTIWINAQVNNATNVNLNYKLSLHEPFSSVFMFDDGLHNDGNAGDKIYGAYIPPLSPNTLVYYYIYAENDDAGKFSPERAEYVCYTFSVNAIDINQGNIVINEFLASNSGCFADEAGEFDDWIEIYNNSTNPINLNRINLSDDFTNKSKWQFPDTIIYPDNYIIVWSDNDDAQGNMHANFKLSSSGESIILSNSNGLTIDSIDFSNQATDISFGRYPNGTGTFQYLYPTPGAENQPLNIKELNKGKILIHPNPANNIISIESINNLINTNITIYNLLMQPVLINKSGINKEKITIDISKLSKGIYLLNVNQTTTKIIVN